ncbi:MAG: MarR family transcriptional regulator [Maribacter sp.]|nr:MAG: MarR family transcriptional regulator [Maribacter sp.]
MNVGGHIKTSKEIPLDQKTIIHIMLVANAINKKLATALKPFDVSIQQFNVLRILRGQNGKPANLGTLNERMVTKMSNTTRLVDKLVLKEFVERHTCPSNRRKTEINITAKGLEQLLKMDDVVSRTEKGMLDQFSKRELKHLNLLLNQFKP